MAHVIYTTPSGHKSLKKLPQNIKKPILKIISQLSDQPRLGNQLEGELKFLYCLHYKHGRVYYRIAYEIYEQNNEIAIHYAGTRENFYQKLRRLKLKPMSMTRN